MVGFYHAGVEGVPGGARLSWSAAGWCMRELLERFRLGFANRTLGYRLPAKNRQAGAELRGRLQRLGVFAGVWA